MRDLNDIRLIALELVPEEVQAWEDKLVAAESFFSQTADLSNAALGLSNQLTQGKINDANKEKDALINAALEIRDRELKIAEQLSDKTVKSRKKRADAIAIIEQTSADTISNINAEADQEISALRKKQKPFLIAEAIANTAVGVTKAFAQGGVFGFISGALIAAAGAVEVATINAQSFARGGSS